MSGKKGCSGGRRPGAGRPMGSLGKSEPYNPRRPGSGGARLGAGRKRKTARPTLSELIAKAVRLASPITTPPPTKEEKTQREKEKWRRLAPEKRRQKIARSTIYMNSNHVSVASDAYIGNLLAKSCSVDRSLIPPELIEAKRWHLKVKRLLKETK